MTIKNFMREQDRMCAALGENRAKEFKKVTGKRLIRTKDLLRRAFILEMAFLLALTIKANDYLNREHQPIFEGTAISTNYESRESEVIENGNHKYKVVKTEKIPIYRIESTPAIQTIQGLAAPEGYIMDPSNQNRYVKIVIVGYKEVATINEYIKENGVWVYTRTIIVPADQVKNFENKDIQKVKSTLK